MTKRLNIFKGSAGINNKLDPVRLTYNSETGIQDLAAGVNVNVDSTGRIGRRKGSTSKLAKAAHSIFSCGDYALFVSGDALCVLNPDYTWSAIRNVAVDARMSYVLAGDTYYANGNEIGIVRDKVSYAWSASDYVGPTTTKTFSDPPVGHLLEVYNGLMFIAQDEVLWYSEPFAFSWFNLASNYVQFTDRITMVKAVSGAVFIGTEKDIFSFKGKNFKEAEQEKIADYPAIEGTAVTVPASRVGDGSMTGLGAMWASTKGICFGGPDGDFRNFTSRKLDYPVTRYGAGLFKDGKYICLLKP